MQEGVAEKLPGEKAEIQTATEITRKDQHKILAKFGSIVWSHNYLPQKSFQNRMK